MCLRMPLLSRDPACLFRGCAGTIVLGLMAASCAQPRTFFHASPRDLVWPASPESPRIRFVGEISGSWSGSRSPSTVQRILFGPAALTQMVTPHAVAVDSTGMLVAVADPNAHGVHVFDLGAKVYLRVDRIDTASTLEAPVGVAWGEGMLFVADPPRSAVDAFVVDVSGRNARHVRAIGAGAFSRPAGMAFDEARKLLYVCDAAAHRIVVIDTSGNVVRTIGGPGGGEGQFRFPAHVTVGPDGALAVSDAMNFRVQRLSPEGSCIAMFGRKGDAAGDLALPKGIAADRDGNLWVVDAHFENVQAFNTKGELLLSLGREGQKPGEFWLPAGACIDRQSRLWIADTYNRRVQVFQVLP